MADIIVSPLIEAVIQKLANEAVKQVGRVKGIRSELESLEETLSHFQDLLVDASEKEITEVPVQKWLNKLKHLVYDIDDILDDLATDAMRPKFVKNSGASTSKVLKLMSSCCTNLSLCCKTHHLLDNINLRLQKLENERTTIGLTVKNGGIEVRNNRSIDPNRGLETSVLDGSSIVGRQVDKDELIDKLLSDDPLNKNFSIVPIVGMGGVGKTTLAKILYNDERVKSHFQHKAWVCVSDNWDSVQISKSIFQHVGGKWEEKFKDFDLLQEGLVKQLREKTFLLVLDDVWTDNDKDWETLVRPFSVCGHGSKVIITTRKDQLLKKLDCGQLNQLQCLSHDDAVSLFCKNALNANNFDLYPTLKPHGEAIVEKCNGLPLALIALGKLLRRKGTDEIGWKGVVDSQIWGLEEGGGIINALKLSYHELPASLKQLFAYCSLFHKDDLFEKDGLVLLWMAEGFLRQSDPSKTEECLGHDYFEELLSRSFFQHAPDDKSLFVMHDLMHDLATSVAGDFFFRLDKDMARSVAGELRHMSFVADEHEAYEKFMVFKEANCLRTLRTFLSVGAKHSWGTKYLPNNVLVDLLPQLRLLRVINLSDYKISEVPECIGSLKHLRYINLARTDITNLPDAVCDLYNLQTLIVFGCYRLAMLPKNFSKLKNLRHLDIRDTPDLKDMPLGIGELKSLQTLSKIIIGGQNDFSIAQLKDLEKLRGSVSIQGLNKVKEAKEAREANLSQLKLDELKLEWSDDESDGSQKEVLDALKPCHGDLKKLEIVNYCGLVFPKWIGDASFLRLARVSMRGCKNCTSLPPFGQLPSLKELYIEDMDNVKFVGSEFLGNGVSFPSLEVLSFVGMQGWEVWSTNGRSTTGVVRDAVFPCLKELRIEGCPSLVKFSFEGDKVFPFLHELCLRDCSNLLEVSVQALPSLSVLRIERCGDGVLRSVVRAAPSVTKLYICRISGLTNGVVRDAVFPCLKVLHIEDCPNLIEFSFKGDAVFLCVKELRINGCPSLVKFSFEGDQVFPFLQELFIYGCSNLLEVSVQELPSLRVLTINGSGAGVLRSFVRAAPSVAVLNISFISGLTNEVWRGVILDLKAVEELDISWCDEIRYLWESKEAHAGRKVLMNLRTLEVSSCENMVGLGEKDEEEEEYNYGSNLETLEKLKSVNINRCDKLFLLKEELGDLIHLTNLIIEVCPNVDVPTTDGVWPPNLRSLQIGHLKKPILEWGTQKFPTTLDDLTLVGKTDSATSWSELSHLHLPSSLTQLAIVRFYNLETISEGLQHLTSLQHLYILRCPKLKDLPETLLPSLLSLEISKCRILKERCSEGGSYWPHISHIPYIRLR